MRCLLLVDLQYDFMPGGALAVAEGDQVVAVANRLIPHFDMVVATQDWHPANHKSFASQHAGMSIGDVVELDGLEQMLWPDHCVQGTRGAALHADLDVRQIHHVVQKGTDERIDSYSGLFDNGHRQATGLGDLLERTGVSEIYVMGLATDYCVMFTAIDSVQLGLKTFLIADGCRGVNLNAGDVERALERMREAGIQIVDSRHLNEQTNANR